MAGRDGTVSQCQTESSCARCPETGKREDASLSVCQTGLDQRCLVSVYGSVYMCAVAAARPHTTDVSLSGKAYIWMDRFAWVDRKR
mmetsp:Transcript_34036/g.84147  ORF Transcript_34036/g.84147 Transcript_34036/m.84147 type:complete len:86 (+) Transcript_34036:233-490(+)